MEEILASIRRIIADDGTAKPVASAPSKPAEPPKPVAPPPPRPAAAIQPRSPNPPSPRPAAPSSVVRDLPPPPRDLGTVPDGSVQALVNELPAENHSATAELDILDLTEAMTASVEALAPAAAFKTIDGQPDIIFAESVPVPTPQSDVQLLNAAEDAPRLDKDDLKVSENAPPESPLLSSSTMAAVDSAFNTLAHTVLVQNARTLEDLVREMLRPMLKSWLDDNLPGLVERLVRAEIERVSRGRG